MLCLFANTNDEIMAGDLQMLIDEQSPESDRFGCESALPTRKRKDPDSWRVARKRIGKHTNKQLMKEVLNIGVGDDEEDHDVAGSIQPIPRCTERARRLERVFREGIGHNLPQQMVRDVKTEDRESDVTVLGIAKSRSAPHREKSGHNCTLCPSTRCEELSLKLSRDVVALDQAMNERNARLEEELDRNVYFTVVLLHLPFQNGGASRSSARLPRAMPSLWRGSLAVSRISREFIGRCPLSVVTVLRLATITHGIRRGETLGGSTEALNGPKEEMQFNWLLQTLLTSMNGDCLIAMVSVDKVTVLNRCNLLEHLKQLPINLVSTPFERSFILRQVGGVNQTPELS